MKHLDFIDPEDGSTIIGVRRSTSIKGCLDEALVLAIEENKHVTFVFYGVKVTVNSQSNHAFILNQFFKSHKCEVATMIVGP